MNADRETYPASTPSYRIGAALGRATGCCVTLFLAWSVARATHQDLAQLLAVVMLLDALHSGWKSPR